MEMHVHFSPVCEPSCGQGAASYGLHMASDGLGVASGVTSCPLIADPRILSRGTETETDSE